MTKAKPIQGKDLMLFVDGKAVALSKSCKVSISMETSDTQSKDSGGWSEKAAKKASWNCSTENLFSADETVSSYDTLVDLMLSREPVDIMFGVADNATADEVPAGGWTAPKKGRKGKVIITSVEANAPDGDVATFSVNMEGTGKLDKIAAAQG